MNRNVLILGMILLTQLFFGCKDQSTTPDSLDVLQLHFVSGSIGANLMPIVPADPISGQIVIVAENTSQTHVLTDLSAPRADVFLTSSNQKLGTITFTTSWDGQLGQLERDTIRFSKVISHTTLFNAQCNKYVYLNIVVQNDPNNYITLKTDSLEFSCVF